MSFVVSLATVSLIAVGASLSALWQVRRTGHGKYLSEMQRIEWATEMLAEHSHALDQFMALPNASESLKTFVLTASDLFENRAFVRYMAGKLKTGPSADENADTEIWSLAQTLCAEDTGAYDLFVRALFSGLMSALLRWPETAPVLSRPHAPTQDYIRNEIVITARAVRETAAGGWPGSMATA